MGSAFVIYGFAATPAIFLVGVPLGSLQGIAGQVTETNALANRLIAELADTRRELEQRERALLEQNQLFLDAVERADACQRAFAGAAMGIAVIDLNGRFTHVNQALCRLTGYSATELYETAFGALTHPDDVPANVQLLQHVMEEDTFGLVAECRLVRRNGDTVSVRNSLSLQLSKGKPANIIVLVEDISKIIEYGVMSPPALVVDGEVRFCGSVPNVADIKKILKP